MSGSMNETEVAQTAVRILSEAVKSYEIPKGVPNSDQTLAASSWLGYMSAKRLEALNNRMVRWTAAAAIAGSAAATLSLSALIIILHGLR